MDGHRTYLQHLYHLEQYRHQFLLMGIRLRTSSFCVSCIAHNYVLSFETIKSYYLIRLYVCFIEKLIDNSVGNKCAVAAGKVDI